MPCRITFKRSDVTVTVIIASLLFLCSLCTNLPQDCQGYFKRNSTSGVCYRIMEGLKAFDDALVACSHVGKGGRLLAIPSKQVNDIVRELVAGAALNSVWIGLKETWHIWKWISGEEVYRQGCYTKATLGQDIISTIIEYNSHENCTLFCRENNQRYAGIQNATSCWCASQLGKHRHSSSSCTIECPGNSRQYCGDVDSSEVFAVNGSFSYWLSGHPDNYYGYQTCALLRHENDMRWSDGVCSEYHGVICEMDLDEVTCSARDDHVLVGGRCFFVHTSSNTWFVSREFCQQLKGTIARVNSARIMADLLPYLLAWRQKKSFWIGLQRSTWAFSNGGEILSYSSWAAGKPDGPNHHCAVLARDGTWDDVPCNSKRRYICQNDIDIVPPTSLPSSDDMSPSSDDMSSSSSSFSSSFSLPTTASQLLTTNTLLTIAEITNINNVDNQFANDSHINLTHFTQVTNIYSNELSGRNDSSTNLSHLRSTTNRLDFITLLTSLPASEDRALLPVLTNTSSLSVVHISREGAIGIVVGTLITLSTIAVILVILMMIWRRKKRRRNGELGVDKEKKSKNKRTVALKWSRKDRGPDYVECSRNENLAEDPTLTRLASSPEISQKPDIIPTNHDATESTT